LQKGTHLGIKISARVSAMKIKGILIWQIKILSIIRKIKRL
jgi:hypothetical protein